MIKSRILPLSALVAVLMLSGCASIIDAKQPYYACYFGKALQEKCLATKVDEDRKLVCVDVSIDTDFDLPDCDVQVQKKTYSWF